MKVLNFYELTYDIILVSGIQHSGLNFFPFILLYGAAPEACGSSKARGQTGATAAGLRHSHSNLGSEPCL